MITAEGVPTSMHHFRLSAVCFQTSFTAALSLNAYCHTDTYFQCTGGLHDVAILKALQIIHYNQFSCELLSFLHLNIHILATKRKKEGFFLSTNNATNARYVVNSVKLFEDADII